ncbi:MAG: hypothetical protein A2V99_13100 [Spirochaetes bacterium RBG_16_67_19]|nr:MAG: hypothetical protein A2V99_13100 [Spirochaetes bacterium RBG_16_67_19]
MGFLGEVRDGAFCEEIVLDSQSVAKISPEVPFDLAVLAEPTAVCLHALRQATLTPASRILVLGGGPIGALLFTILNLRNHDSTAIAEPSEYRRSILSKIRPEMILERSVGEFDVVFDSSGSEQAFAQLLAGNLAKQGQVIVVGLYRQSSCFNLTRVVENEWRIAGSSVFTDELLEAVRLLEENWRKFAPIVTHRFPLKEIGQALKLVLSPQKEAMKVVLHPRS